MVTENSSNELKYLQGTEISLEDIQKKKEQIQTEEKEEKEEKERLQYFTE